MLWNQTALLNDYILFSSSIPKTAEWKLSTYKASLI